MVKQNKKHQKYSILKVILTIYIAFSPFFCNFAITKSQDFRLFIDRIRQNIHLFTKKHPNIHKNDGVTEGSP